MAWRLIGTAVLVGWWWSAIELRVGHAQTCTCPVLKTIRFGQTTPLTGTNSDSGTPVRDGILAAFNEYNQDAGDSKRFQLELVMKDDVYDSAVAKQNVELFAQDPTILGIIGAAGTASIEAAAPIAIANNLPFFGTYGGMKLRQPFQRHVISVRGSYVDESAAIVKFLVSQASQRIALFAQNDALGENARSGLLSALDSYNLYLHSEGYYTKNMNATIWTQESATALQNMTHRAVSPFPPNAVVVAAMADPAAIFVRQLRAVWPKIPVVCLSSVSFALFVNTLAPTINDTWLIQNLYSSQFVPNPVTSTAPIVQQFRAACQRIGVTTPRNIALEGYLMARLAISVLERTKGNFTQEAFINQLYADSFFNFNGFRFGPFYPQNVDGGCNQGIHEVHIVQAQTNKSLVDVFTTSHTSCGYQPKQWKTLTFGQSCTFSGSQATLCEDFRDGLLASFKETNDAGGIRGDTRLQLVTKDDSNNPRLALLNNYEFLEDPQVFGLIGTGIAGMDAVVDLVSKSDKVLFGPFSGVRSLHEPFQPRIINYRANVDDEIAAMVHHWYYTKRISRVGVLYEATLFGTYRRDQLQGALKEKRWDLHSEASFTSNSSTDITAAVTKLFAGNGATLQVIVLFSLWDVVGDVMLSVHARNRDVMIFGITKTVVGQSILQMNEALQANVNMNNFIQTAVVPDPFDTNIEIAGKYRTAMHRFNPRARVSAAGLEGFVVGQMLAISLTRVMGGELSVDNLIETVFANGFYNMNGLRCGPLTWITSNSSRLTSCNQCMKNVYLLGLNQEPITDVFSFEDTCGYVIPDNLDFELHSTRMIMAVMAAIGIGYSVVVLVLLLVYRKNPHLTSVSVASAFMTCVGGCLCYGGIFVIYPIPTNLSCTLQSWITDVAFVLLVGPILAKLFRIDLVVNAKAKAKKKKRVFSDVSVLPMVSVLLVGFVVFLGIYTAIDPPRMTEQFTSDGLRFESCVIQHNGFAYVDYGLKAMILLWGCLVAQRVSSIHGHGTRFQESKRLMLCMYHTAFLGFCLVLLGFTTKSHPTINFVCVSSILILNTTFVVTLLCARPVVMAIRKVPIDENSTGSTVTMCSGAPVSSLRRSGTSINPTSSSVSARLSRPNFTGTTSVHTFHEISEVAAGGGDGMASGSI